MAKQSKASKQAQSQRRRKKGELLNFERKRNDQQLFLHMYANEEEEEGRKRRIKKKKENALFFHVSFVSLPSARYTYLQYTRRTSFRFFYFHTTYMLLPLYSKAKLKYTSFFKMRSSKTPGSVATQRKIFHFKATKQILQLQQLLRMDLNQSKKFTHEYHHLHAFCCCCCCMHIDASFLPWSLPELYQLFSNSKSAAKQHEKKKKTKKEKNRRLIFSCKKPVANICVLLKLLASLSIVIQCVSFGSPSLVQLS